MRAHRGQTLVDVGQSRQAGIAGARARPARAGVGIAAVLGAVLSALVPISGQAQQGQDAWRPDTRVAPTPPQPGVGGFSVPPNVTVVPRSAPPGSAQEVQLTAFLTDDGAPIDQGLVWHIFQDGEKDGAPVRHHRTVRDANPVIRLTPGRYLVNVSFGRANLTRTLVVEPGATLNERFVLNAGGLRVSAQLGNGTPAPEAAVSFDIFSGETDQLGNRQRIMSGARPGLVIRLNAGIFHIVSRYGDANAVINADVTVEAGKLTEVAIAHPGATVTFKLVTRPGGEAQSGAQWAILDPDGEVIKESAGALPTHVLAAGSYVVTASHSGRVFRHGFTVQPGEMAQIEVVMK